MSTTAADILALLDAAGETVKVFCPGCGVVVDLAEVLAHRVALLGTTEAQQMKSAEDAIFAADATVAVVRKAAAPPAAPSPRMPSAVSAWPTK